MINGIIDTINDNITASWIDVKGGLAKTLQVEVKTGIGTVTKRFPGWINDNRTTCANDQYLTAEIKQKGLVMFWLERSNSVENLDCDGVIITHSVELVVWVNHKMLDKTKTNSDHVKKALRYLIPSKVSYDSTRIYTDFTGFTDNPLEAYDYNEAKKQYNTYPFECFGITYDISYYSNSGCVSIVTEGNDICF